MIGRLTALWGLETRIIYICINDYYKYIRERRELGSYTFYKSKIILNVRIRY